jgi:Protein of unknown function DUF262
MMRGYPFGTFLFWQIEAETASKFSFYEFMRRYHERDAKTCRELPSIGERQVTAVLDGQQRLTALNIGLSGSRAIKLPNKRRSNNQAYPETFLFLDLLAETNDQEEGMESTTSAFLRPRGPPSSPSPPSGVYGSRRRMR